MLTSFYADVAENLVVATILAVVVCVIARFWKNPAVRHALWLIVLLKLVVPPVVSLPILPTAVLPATDFAPVAARPTVDHPATDNRSNRTNSATRPAEINPPAVRSGAAPNPVGAAGPTAEFSWGVVLAAVWAAGSTVWLAIAAVRIFRFHRVIGRAAAADAETCELALQVAGRLGYLRPLDVRVSAGQFPPLLWALGRPRIVLPEFAVTELTTIQLKGILAHEVAHLVRRDHWVRWFELLVFAGYWWNPVVWWARRELRAAEEQACDARVVACYAGIDHNYLEALIAVIDRFQLGAAPVPTAASALGDSGTLKQRVEAILAHRDWRLRRLGFAIVAVAAISLLVTVRSAADPPRKPQSPTPQPAEPQAAPPVEMLEKTVRVVNAHGEPIAAATVAPWAIRTTHGAHGPWSEANFGKCEPPTLTTDADGNATIPFPRFAVASEKIKPRELTCRVYHPDYAETYYNNVTVTPAELPITTTIGLEDGAHLEVAAFAAGDPLPMDRVRAMWSSPWRSDGPTQPKVNAEGRMELPRLPAGTELLQLVYVPEQGPLLISEVETLTLANGDRRELRFEMKPTLSVSGQLDASVGRPVKNGRVCARVVHRTDDAVLSWDAYAIVQPDGSFELEELPHGELQVIALCDGFMAASGAPPHFLKQEPPPVSRPDSPQTFRLFDAKNHIVVTMVPTASCRIHVLGPDGQPLADVRCGFSPNVHWWGGGSRIYCSPLISTAQALKDPKAWAERAYKREHLFAAKTNADGIALVNDLPPHERHFGVYHEQFSLPIGPSNRRQAAVELTGGEQTDVTVHLQPRGTQFIGSQ